MKKLLAALLITGLYGCSATLEEKPVVSAAVAEPCLGTTDLPAHYQGKFEAVEDAELLASTIGEPKKGKLCQGKVYQSKADTEIIIYRAWNSTNPNSQFGKWWASAQPAGKVADYRADYEICYQWSPLDKLVSCRLKAGVNVVIGNGQSAECSQYLTYPVSAEQQIYIDDASNAVESCSVYDGEFSWK